MSKTSSDDIIQNIEWTEAHENILKEWKAKAFAYLWLQNNSCYFYLRIQNWLAYTVIVLSSISSATIFTVTTSTDKSSGFLTGTPFFIIQYVIGGLSLLSAILTGVIRQLKPGEMYQQHASIAKRYHNLIRSIDTCLSLTVKLRPNPAVFIERAGIELDSLANAQIEPPRMVIKNFENIYGPLERVLYGEDVVELWKLTYETNKLEQRLKNRLNIFSSDRFEDNKKNVEGKNFNINEDFEKEINRPPHVKIIVASDNSETQSNTNNAYLINKFKEPFGAFMNSKFPMLHKERSSNSGFLR